MNVVHGEAVGGVELLDGSSHFTKNSVVGAIGDMTGFTMIANAARDGVQEANALLDKEEVNTKSQHVTVMRSNGRWERDGLKRGSTGVKS